MFRVEDNAAGKKTKCPKCGAAIWVPSPVVTDVPSESADSTCADEVVDHSPAAPKSAEPSCGTEDIFRLADEVQSSEAAESIVPSHNRAGPSWRPDPSYLSRDDALDDNSKHRALRFLAGWHWIGGILGLAIAGLFTFATAGVWIIGVVRKVDLTAMLPATLQVALGVGILIVSGITSLGVAEAIKLAIDLERNTRITNSLLRRMLGR
jgi:hypothetical protein